MAATRRPHHILKSAPQANAGQIAYEKQLLADANTSYNYINGKPGRPVGIAPDSAVYTMRNGYDKDSLTALNSALTDLGIPHDARRLPYYMTALRENAGGDPTLDNNPTSPHSRGLMQVSDSPSYNTALHLLDNYAKQGPRIVGSHPPKFAPGLLEVLHKNDETPIPQAGGYNAALPVFQHYGARYKAMGWNGKNVPPMFSTSADGKTITPNIYQAAIDYMNGKRTPANIKAISLLLHDAKFNAILGITNQRELLAKYSTPKYAVKGINPDVLADIAYIDPKVADKIAAAAQAGRYGDNVATLLHSKEFGPAMSAKQIRHLMQRNGDALDGTVGDVLKYHIGKTTSLLPMREANRQRAIIDGYIMPPQQLPSKPSTQQNANAAAIPAPATTSTVAGLSATQAAAAPAPDPNLPSVDRRAREVLEGADRITVSHGLLSTLGITNGKVVRNGETLHGADARINRLAVEEVKLEKKREAALRRGDLKGLKRAEKIDERMTRVDNRIGKIETRAAATGKPVNLLP